MATAKKTPAKRAAVRKSAPKAPAPAKTISMTSAVPVATKNAKPGKAEKPRKPKLVRDSFTIPKTEYAALDALKQRAALSGNAAKKSEVLRAGIMALTAMSDAAFAAAIGAVPAVKTGRPAKT